eukprot:Rmarinus@m.27766
MTLVRLLAMHSAPLVLLSLLAELLRAHTNHQQDRWRDLAVMYKYLRRQSSALTRLRLWRWERCLIIRDGGVAGARVAFTLPSITAQETLMLTKRTTIWHAVHVAPATSKHVVL